MLYSALLYEALAASNPDFIVVGFADDTNLLSVGRDSVATCARLQAAWDTCNEWALSHGMEFAPEKSELMHFIRTHKGDPTSIRFGPATVTPVESARFFGVWLDRKLNWLAHVVQVQRKSLV